jgi:MFS family permease
MALTVFGFSFALGTSGLVLPLLALAAGYGPAAVGLLAATSAISQFIFRLTLPWLLGRYADRLLLGVACLVLAGSYALLIITTAGPVFIVAQLMQGAARATFWTASQTHAVRARAADAGQENGSVRSIARVQLVTNIGTIFGPALAGLAAGISLDLALAIALASSLAAAAFSRGMRHLKPFSRQSRRGQPRIWRRPQVDLACWAGFTAGGWRSLLQSYVPVVLTGAGLAPSLIGGLLALADAASMAAAAILVRFAAPRPRAAIEGGMVVACACLVVLPIVAGSTAAVALLMAMGGFAGGVLVMFAPALASDSVAPHERGDVIAVVGTFRAAALLAVPAAVAAGLAFVSLPVGMSLAGIAIAVPGTVTAVRARLPGGDARAA